MDSIIDFLKNKSFTPSEIWTFVVGAVALISGLVVIRTSSKPKVKELTFKLLCNFPILSVGDSYKGKLAVSYKGRDVKSVYRFTFAIINTGDLIITKDDFEGPLKIAFSKNLKCLDVNVPAKVPKDIDIDYSIENSKINVTPFMLNEGEYIVFDALFDGENRDFSVSGRIKDIPEFNFVKPETDKLGNDSPIRLMIIGSSFAMLSLLCLVAVNPVKMTASMFVIPIIGMGFLLAGGFVLLKRKYSFQDEIFFLGQANKWYDVQINRIKL